MKSRPTLFRSLWPPIVVLIIAIAGMYLAAKIVNAPYLLPRPDAVVRVIIKRRTTLLASLWTTTEASLIGFASSAIAGVAFGMILSASSIIRRALYPYTVFFQTVPIVAIAPLLMIWCGPGLLAVSMCSFIVSVFPVIANTLTGLLSTDPASKTSSASTAKADGPECGN